MKCEERQNRVRQTEGGGGRGGGEKRGRGGGESLQPHLGWSFEHYQSGWSQRGRGWDVVKRAKTRNQNCHSKTYFKVEMTIEHDDTVDANPSKTNTLINLFIRR